MPFAESMISVVKSNKNIMLNKSRHFRKTKSIYKHAEKPEYNLPNATPQILSEIKERLERERKLRILKITVFILLVSISIYFNYYTYKLSVKKNRNMTSVSVFC